MAITSIQRDQNNNVSIVRITVDTDLSAVIVPNYIAMQQDNIYKLNKGTWTWFETDTLLISGNDANAFFEFTDLTFSTIEKIAPSPNGIVNPGLINQVAYYAATGNEVSGRRSSAPNIVYLAPAPYGNDSGDGSILAPFATLSHAMSTITTASPTNLFEIRFQMGSYTDSAIALKPYVNVNGQGSSLSISGIITADASWSSGGTIQFGNFDNFSTSISINFDVSSASSQCIAEFYRIRFANNNSVNIYGGNLILILDTLYSFTDDLNVYVQDAYGEINSSSVLNLTYLATSSSLGYNFQVSQSYVFDTCDFTSGGGAVGISSYITASKLIGTLNATGTNANLLIDCASLTVSSLPNVSFGATVQYINVANTLTANYSPVNYIPDASGSTSPVTSVAAHLHGIDNAIGSHPITSNNVYVSIIGSDATGNGSINNPFATLSYAMSSISTASQASPFTIFLLDGQYTESSFNLKPFVNIVGANTGTTINFAIFPVASTLGLDPSWDNITGYAYYSNFIIYGANVILDFTPFTGASSPQMQFNNVFFGGSFSINGAVATPYVTTYQCYFSGAASVDNLNYSSWLNNYSSGMSAGLNTVVSPLYYFAMGDLYNFTNLGGADSGSYPSQYNINSSQMGTIDLYGSLTSLSIDSASYIPVVIASGTPTINLLNTSDGILANYTPVNYTPSASYPVSPLSVQANLAGIDYKLGTFGSPTTSDVYVSVNGSDGSGNGSLQKPFATISHAIASITGNNVNHIYNVIVTAGIYTETNPIGLKPFTFITCSSQAIISTANITIDPSWNTLLTANAVAGIYGLITNGSLTLNFSSSSSISKLIYLNNLTVYGSVSLNGGSAVGGRFIMSGNTFFSTYASINCTVISRSNFYVSTYTSGNTTLLGNTSSTHTGDIFYSSISISAPSSGFTNIEQFSGCYPATSISISGNAATVYFDPSSYVTPTLTGTPTINFLSVANSVKTNYTASNFTATDTSVKGSIQGIDNILSNFNTGNKSLGTNTNDNASSGHVGEYISNSATSVSLSNGTAATITSISLTAGDWEVSGVIEFIPFGTTTVQQYISSISTTANTLPTVLTENNIQSITAAFTTGSTNILNCGATRISIASTTTVFLVGRSSFGVSTMTASGFIKARRVR